MNFTDKVVVVTGASAGIGEAIAIAFAKHGAEVALVGRNEERLNKVAKQCDPSGKKTMIIKAEFTKEDETSSVISKVVEKFKKIDVLVNNAGAYVEGKILDGSILKAYDDAMMVNLNAPMILITKAAPYLVKTKGNVVNISSIPFHDNVMFGVTKAGLDNLTRCAAFELGASGVRVNSVNLGTVKTAALMAYEDYEAHLKTIKNSCVLKKLIEPEEVAELTMFLASDKAKSITGENYSLDNGFRLKAATMF